VSIAYIVIVIAY